MYVQSEMGYQKDHNMHMQGTGSSGRLIDAKYKQ